MPTSSLPLLHHATAGTDTIASQGAMSWHPQRLLSGLRVSRLCRDQPSIECQQPLSEETPPWTFCPSVDPLDAVLQVTMPGPVPLLVVDRKLIANHPVIEARQHNAPECLAERRPYRTPQVLRGVGKPVTVGVEGRFPLHEVGRDLFGKDGLVGCTVAGRAG